MSSAHSRWINIITAQFVLLLLARLPAQAQQPALSGVVSDQTTGRPIANAQVLIVGTQLSESTRADGRYVFRNAPAGEQQLRVTMLGYATQTRTLNLSVRASATADFALSISALTLDELVVTATGEQRRREVGHSVARIDAATLTQTRAVSNMNDLLAARTPGVTVTPGNLTGAEARIRIRGSNSLSLSNDPVYYIDGIRMESAGASSSIGIGGTLPSRVNDLNPEEIESIEFVKGPAASTLYGTDAANGVIVIKTKKGRVGQPQWQAYVESGAIRDNNTYPTAYRGWTTGSAADNNVQCILTQVAAGTCIQERISTFNLFDDPDASPLGTGYRQQYGLQVSGGLETTRYFLSGEWEDELGVLQMPQFAQDQLMAERVVSDVPEEQERPNARRRVSLRANVGSSVAEDLDVQISTGFVTSSQRLPQTDNNTTGLLSNALGGPGMRGHPLRHPIRPYSRSARRTASEAARNHSSRLRKAVRSHNGTRCRALTYSSRDGGI